MRYICSIQITTGQFPEDPKIACRWYISLSLKKLFNFDSDYETIASQDQEDLDEDQKDLDTQTRFQSVLKHEYHQSDDGKFFDMATGTRPASRPSISSNLNGATNYRDPYFHV
jgi:hypothetical protein